MISILLNHSIRTKGRMIICLFLLSCPLFQIEDVFAKSNANIVENIVSINDSSDNIVVTKEKEK
ncbi:MAG: hypothetical protein QNK40_14390 [Desulfobacterales bacterium]|nr:hypothetical protein [Desulfobacterales bacterium]